MRTNLLAVFFLLFAFSSCKKDDDCNVASNQPAFGWQYIVNYKYFTGADFNPNNANEFIFSFQPNGTGKTKLCKFNLQTSKYTVLYEGSILSCCKWGKAGWIVMGLSDGNIWKIKDDGQNLTQLTFSNNAFNPLWNYDFTQIAFEFNNHSRDETIIIDSLGNSIDTLTEYGVAGSSCWNNRDYFATAGCVDINIYNPITKQFTSVAQNPDPNSGCTIGVSFIGDNQLIWSGISGIYSTNIIDKSTHKLLSSCATNKYLCPSYSAISQKILWTRLSMHKDVSKGMMYVRGYIVMTNIDGSNEHEIVMPL